MIGNSSIQSSHVVKNLGVILDDEISMDPYVSHLCRTCYFHLRAIGHIRKYITKGCATILVQSLIHSRLDYCNSPCWWTSQVSRRPDYRKSKILPHILSLCNPELPTLLLSSSLCTRFLLKQGLNSSSYLLFTNVSMA